MRNNRSKHQKAGLMAIAVSASLCGPAWGGAKIAVDDTHWVSVGAGLRTSFKMVEDGANSGDDYSKNFAIDNMRLYIGGQIHEKIKFTFNTDIEGACTDGCGDNAELFVLDAIAQFELMPQFNIWAGRMLTPADRIEMNGPFYSLTWNQYTVPLFPSDQNNNDAGKYGRDNGVTFWGNLNRFQYAVGLFDGYNGDSNQEDSLLWAGRFAYNFLNKEQNPGYYTSSTYYGGLGNIFTLGFVVQHQKDGAGTSTDSADFTGYALDGLWEQLIGSHVLTVEGEYKWFDTDLSDLARADLDPDDECFCLFDGTSWFATGAWLFPAEVGIGKFQPYLRYTKTNPSSYADDSDLTELGLNYVIKSHNAKLNVNFTQGDADASGTPGPEEVLSFTIGAQLQI